MDITQLAPMFEAATARELNADELDAFNHYFITKKISGLDATLGVSYTSVGPDGVDAELTVTAGHLQPAGFVNGGVFCSIGESLASVAGFVATGGKAQVMGMTNNTQFIRPATKGTVILGQARAVNLGRTTQLWDVTMTNKENGKLLARTSLRTTVMGRE